MITDIKKGEFGIEGKIYSKVFNTEMEVMIDDNVSIEYAQKCAEHFNTLNRNIVETICKASKAYCLWFIKVADGDWENDLSVMVNSDTPPEKMLECFSPTVLIIEEPEDENRIGYKLECSCDWEIEHGMEIDIIDNKVVYLSSYNDYSPWLEYDNSKYNFLNQI